MASHFSDQLIRQYRIGTLHIKRFAEDFTDEEARTAPPGQFPLVWFLSHLLCAHDYFLKMYVKDYVDSDEKGSSAAFGVTLEK